EPGITVGTPCRQRIRALIARSHTALPVHLMQIREHVSPKKRSRRKLIHVTEGTMRYRVTFMERTGGAGQPSEFPPDYVAIEVSDGVVLEKNFVERTAPSALHSEERLEEDDDFLSIGSETWDYDIADGREREFLDAVRNSQIAMECVELDSSPSPE